jgi:hypothetical protein
LLWLKLAIPWVDVPRDPLDRKPVAEVLKSESVAPNLAPAIQGERNLYIMLVSQSFIGAKEPLQQSPHINFTPAHAV